MERPVAELARITRYKPEQSVCVYPTSGDFDDWMYSELHVLAFSIELASAFVPDEPMVPMIVSRNLDAAMYLPENATAPFR